MKATDLMLGDWVLCDGKPYQVAEISAGLLCIDAERELFADPEDLHPLPLTAEILERNGFTRFGTGYILKGERFGLENPSDPNNYLDTYWLRVSIKAVGMESVHQLQHALRLCGIEKEIVL